MTSPTREYEGYIKIRDENSKLFEVNFPRDLASFHESLEKLRLAWAPLGSRRGLSGESHVGLLIFSQLLIRHCIFGFEKLACAQSYLAWSNFRAGLEAFLIAGKLVDDPANARIWSNRASNLQDDRNAYRKTFSGSALEPKSIARGKELRQVLTRLNDDCMHPNPDFTYRDVRRVEIEGSKDLLLQVEFFDATPELREAHILAYLNLVAILVEESVKLVAQLCGVGDLNVNRNTYEGNNRERALGLASATPNVREILEVFGLWRL